MIARIKLKYNIFSECTHTIKLPLLGGKSGGMLAERSQRRRFEPKQGLVNCVTINTEDLIYIGLVFQTINE